MSIFDYPLFDFNRDGEVDACEMMIGLQMTASSRQEAIDLTGDDSFYPGTDKIDEDDDLDDIAFLDDDERREVLEEAGYDPDDFDDFDDF